LCAIYFVCYRDVGYRVGALSGIVSIFRVLSGLCAIAPCANGTRSASSSSPILAAILALFLVLSVQSRAPLAWTEERRSSAISSVHQYAAVLEERRIRGIDALHAPIITSMIHPMSSSRHALPSSLFSLSHKAARIEEYRTSSSSFFRAHRCVLSLAIRRRARMSLGWGWWPSVYIDGPIKTRRPPPPHSCQLSARPRVWPK